jgi:hypothetical protein
LQEQLGAIGARFPRTGIPRERSFQVRLGERQVITPPRNRRKRHMGARSNRRLGIERQHRLGVCARLLIKARLQRPLRQRLPRRGVARGCPLRFKRCLKHIAAKRTDQAKEPAKQPTPQKTAHFPTATAFAPSGSGR